MLVDKVSRGRGRLLLAAWLLTAAAAPVDGGLTDFRQGHFAEALRDWRDAAQAGDARAALYLGVMFDTGEGVPQDYARARIWYERAAAAGSATAMFNLGVLDDAGLGLGRPDRVAAAHWYGRAAARGSARGAYNLALLYQSGDGVRRDRARALVYFRKARRLGVAAAATHLPAPSRADKQNAPSGDDGQDAFQAAQTALLERSPGGAARALDLLHAAALRRNALAAYDLGYCYQHGLGTAADPARAQVWYARAADESDDPEMRSIARAAAAALSSGASRPAGSAR